jgi:hypothetical protein
MGMGCDILWQRFHRRQAVVIRRASNVEGRHSSFLAIREGAALFKERRAGQHDVRELCVSLVRISCATRKSSVLSAFFTYSVFRLRGKITRSYAARSSRNGTRSSWLRLASFVGTSATSPRPSRKRCRYGREKAFSVSRRRGGVRWRRAIATASRAGQMA